MADVTRKRLGFYEPAWASYLTTGTQSCANNTDTYVDFNGTAEATHAAITKTTSTGSVFTFNRPGLYIIVAQAVWASSVNGKREIHIANAADANVRWGSMTTDCSGNPLGTPNVSAIHRFAVADAVKILVSQNSGGALDLEIKAWGVRPRVSFAYIGP